MSRRERYERRCARAEPRPLRITAHLCTPVASPYVHLDGLLAWRAGHEAHYPSFSRSASPTSSSTGIVDLPLPFAREGVVWCASCLWPEPSAPPGRTHWHMRPALEYAHLLRARQVTIAGGPTKAHRRELRIWPARQMVAYALGDEAMIGSLLRRVGAVGKKTSQGYGVVERWEIVPDADALVAWWEADGAARRPLPAPGGLLSGVRPPYWYRPWWEPALSPGDLIPEAMSA